MAWVQALKKDSNHGDGRTSPQDVLSEQHLQFASQTSTMLHAKAPSKAACSRLAAMAERCHNALSPAEGHQDFCRFHPYVPSHPHSCSRLFTMFWPTSPPFSRIIIGFAVPMAYRKPGSSFQNDHSLRVYSIILLVDCVSLYHGWFYGFYATRLSQLNPIISHHIPSDMP